MNRIITEVEAPDDTEDQTQRLYRAAAPVRESIPDFPAVTGICRECVNAFIYQRQYGEEVTVICDTAYPPRPMPLDIIRCSRFEKRGQMSLDRMQDMAAIVDKRESSGQYL